MSRTQTQNILNRTARIEGHVQAIHQMVQADRSYPEIIVQIVAVRSALNKVAQITLADHAEHCLVQATQGDEFASE